jgi:hypothetical protein
MQHIIAAIERAAMHGMDITEVQLAASMCECPSHLVQAVEDAAKAKDALGVGYAWARGGERVGVR